MKIKTAFLFDPMDDMEEEAESATFFLEDEAGLEIKEVLRTTTIQQVIEYTGKIDLLIVDYGGLYYGAYDTAKSHIKYACKFAEDHPGCLMLIWSQFTYDIYQAELEEAFGHLTNIATKESYRTIMDWFGLDN